jgi:hypothetical protein
LSTESIAEFIELGEPFLNCDTGQFPLPRRSENAESSSSHDADVVVEALESAHENPSLGLEQVEDRIFMRGVRPRHLLNGIQTAAQCAGTPDVQETSRTGDGWPWATRSMLKKPSRDVACLRSL